MTLDEPALESTTTNQWIIVYTFPSEHLGQFYSAVELLNGVFAEKREKFAGFEDGLINSTRISSKSTPFRSQQSLPYLKILQSCDLSLPHVQWDPSLDEFPVSLRSLVDFGCARLTKDYSLLKDPPYMMNIKLDWFFPESAIREQGLESSSNLHHWFCTIHFLTKKAEHKYTAILLLNGAVLETSEDE